MLHDWNRWLEDLVAALEAERKAAPPAEGPYSQDTRAERSALPKPHELSTLITPELLARLEHHRGEWQT